MSFPIKFMNFWPSCPINSPFLSLLLAFFYMNKLILTVAKMSFLQLKLDNLWYKICLLFEKFSMNLIVKWLKILVHLVPSFSRLQLPSYYGAKCGTALAKVSPFEFRAKTSLFFRVAYIYLIIIKIGTLKN